MKILQPRFINAAWVTLWGVLFLHFVWGQFQYSGGWKHYVCEGYAIFCLFMVTGTWWFRGSING